ncbi:glycosyltransferase [Paenibacillus chartarius]|uniref:Glycosyltransferase n=1 Tax=Paenibacillus chartarius TaxID=747481 RepID=A0ABV6DRK1_9BACL
MAILVYPPTIDWDWMMQRPQQLMKYFARAGHTVYYCNRTLEDAPAEEIEPGLFIVKHHERWLEREWKPAKARLQAPVIVWCSLPQLASSLRQYDPDLIVYDCVDEFAEWAPYEREMAACADAVVCTSERLRERLDGRYPGKRLALVRNAYDLDMGLHLPNEDDAAMTPADLPAGPTIGYIGAWAPWVNPNLLLYTARLQRQAQIVVIGPEFGRPFAPYRSGIRFLGMKPHRQLSSYLRRLSVGLIPFRLTAVTLATNPVKAYEYLAAGIPVVSTSLPECRMMMPYVDTAADAADFHRLTLERLQDAGDREARKRFALCNTWAHRVQEIEAFLFG